MEGRAMYQIPAVYLPEDFDYAATACGYPIKVFECKEEEEFQKDENGKHGVDTILGIENDYPADGVSNSTVFHVDLFVGL